jgi:cell wall-associated NlpC family hydrolase
MKKLLAIAAMTALMTTCGIQAKAQSTYRPEIQVVMQENFIDYLVELKRTKEINARIYLLKKQVGKTWYIFSGNTPRGWDCSGLVMWFYSDLGYELEHSVNDQMVSGEIVTEPMIGDIVTLKYKGNKRGYHNGIYAGDGFYIHAPQPGRLTSLDLISASGGSYSDVVYTRIIPSVVD